MRQLLLILALLSQPVCAEMTVEQMENAHPQAVRVYLQGVIHGYLGLNAAYEIAGHQVLFFCVKKIDENELAKNDLGIRLVNEQLRMSKLNLIDAKYEKTEWTETILLEALARRYPC